MNASLAGFTHRFMAAKAENLPPLLLLHGTGGDEQDLLGLGARLLPGAALLSPRGQVSENGMNRFFKRHAEGVFDEEDLKLRTGHLKDFIREAASTYGLQAPLAIGFSNGANIAAALQLLYPGLLCGAILLRAMTPFQQPVTPVHEAASETNGVPILVLSGAFDPIVPQENAEHLVTSLQKAGNQVDHKILPSGHNLSESDLTMAEHFLASHFVNKL